MQAKKDPTPSCTSLALRLPDAEATPEGSPGGQATTCPGWEALESRGVIQRTPTIQVRTKKRTAWLRTAEPAGCLVSVFVQPRAAVCSYRQQGPRNLQTAQEDRRRPGTPHNYDCIITPISLRRHRPRNARRASQETLYKGVDAARSRIRLSHEGCGRRHASPCDLPPEPAIASALQ